MTANLPSYKLRFVHLTAIWAFGVSQPVFGLIGGNPDLLLSRDATRSSVVIFALLLAVVPPALLTAYAWLASCFSQWIGDVLYLCAVGACLAPLAARLIKPVDFGLALAIMLLGALVVAGVVVYARSRVVRLFVGYAVILPLLAFAWFVHGLPPLTENAEAAPIQATSPAPVVFVVFDELPASSLMTRDGQIDAVRYPNFARLAREGTWYRNATTVHEWTSDAVPAMLSGRIGRVSTVPLLNNYPDNLFTLLGGTFTLRVHESGHTRLCPVAYCPRAKRSVVDSSYGLFTDSINLLVPRIFPKSLSDHVIEVNSDISMPNGPYSRSLNELNTVLGEMSRTKSDKALFYNHVLLPHAPWRFLPSGLEYDWRSLDGWYPSEHWANDPWLVLQGYQRHLLQVGYVDRLVGRVLRTLDRSGLYDRSLVIVVADHGASFRAGEGRRPVTGHNFGDITNVPLFVKYPNEAKGRIDERAARNIDLLPTIADVLGVELPWKVDGLSLLGAIPAEREVVFAPRDEAHVHKPLAAMTRARASTLEHKHAQFGAGRDSLYRIGTNKWLLGRDVSAVTDRSTDVDVTIVNAADLAHVRRATGFVPVRISARVDSGRLDADTELAVAVNGRVAALTRSFWDEGDQLLRALVPETTLREGANEVEIFVVRGTGKGASLVSIGSTRDLRQGTEVAGQG